jgi:hypothetical protein
VPIGTDAAHWAAPTQYLGRVSILRRTPLGAEGGQQSAGNGPEGAEPSDASMPNAREEPLTGRLGSSAHTNLRRALLDVVDRVDEIIGTAEQTAEEIRREAQAEADRYLAERKQEAERMEAERARRYQEAVHALRAGIRRIESEGERVIHDAEEAIRHAEPGTAEAPAPAAPPSPAAPTAPPVAEAPRGVVAYPGRQAGPEEGEGERARASMLIRATQLAVQGVEREEIERTLEAEFGVSGAESIVSEVLGRH